MSVTTADIKHLREITGAGILDCKKVLQETDGNIDEAVEMLRKKGLAAASKKASREANEGLVSAQVSDDGKVGVMVEVNCETDFVARTEDFQNFVDSLVRQLFAQPNLNTVEALLAAPYIDNSANTVSEQLTEIIAKLGENTIIRNAVRFDLQSDGIVDSYIHIGGRVGVLVEVSGGSPDNSTFVELVHDLALHIAAASPRYLDESGVPAEAVESEKAIYLAQIAEDKKPENIKERIVEGKLKKWLSEITLVNQPFVKDNDVTIAKLVGQTSKSLGSDIQIRHFARFELGVE
ncbi:MAG: elongation factor Ts [Anaerolineae bacterium]|nr:elongation factor Ts [Anaerolineae bacterium]